MYKIKSILKGQYDNYSPADTVESVRKKYTNILHTAH